MLFEDYTHLLDRIQAVVITCKALYLGLKEFDEPGK